MESIWAALLELFRSLQLILTQSDLAYIIALAGALAALFPFYKRISAFVYKNYLEPIGKFFSTFATLPDRLSSLESKVDQKVTLLQELHYKDVKEIRKELSPNGGTSIKDTVNKLAEGVEKIATSIDNLTTQGTRMELRQQSILNSISVPTFERDNKGNCTYANKAYLDLTGRTMEEVRGMGWLNVIHPEDRERVLADWLRSTAQQRNFEDTFRVVNRQDQMIYEVNVVAEAVSGNGYIGKYESITPIGKL
jgi:PAS domain S-box-containing protein